MRKARYALGPTILVTMFFCLLPVLQAADDPVPDSPEVAELLTQAKLHAAQLAKDADWMRFGISTPSVESHSEHITMIKEHINKLGKVLQQMSDRHEWASPWQQTAIDRITPLARELASNTESIIDHLNNKQNQLHASTYKDYLTANAELSSSLSELIRDFASYGKNKATYQRLGRTLEISR